MRDVIQRHCERFADAVLGLSARLLFEAVTRAEITKINIGK